MSEVNSCVNCDRFISDGNMEFFSRCKMKTYTVEPHPIRGGGYTDYVYCDMIRKEHPICPDFIRRVSKEQPATFAEKVMQWLK